MRAAIDTNVLISGLLWRGQSHQLLAHVRDGRLGLVTSPALLAELADVLKRPKFAKIIAQAGVNLDQMLGDLRVVSEIIDPPPLATLTSRDLDDDNVLALAVASRADAIITGDDDLLALASHAGIPILTPAHALAKLES